MTSKNEGKKNSTSSCLHLLPFCNVFKPKDFGPFRRYDVEKTRPFDFRIHRKRAASAAREGEGGAAEGFDKLHHPDILRIIRLRTVNGALIPYDQRSRSGRDASPQLIDRIFL